MNKASRILFASWLVLTGSAGSPTPCLANSAVTLKPDAEITRHTVKLSDLFKGVPDEIDREVAQAPLPCHPATYTEEVLNRLADANRLDWQSTPDANHVVLSTSCSKITGDMIRDAVIAKVKASGNGKERTYDVAFDIKNLVVELAGNQQPDFKLDNFIYDPGSKQFKTDLTAQSPHGPYTMPITGHISARRNVPVLAHRMESGSTIGAADLDWVQLPEERVTADVITEQNQLVGREVRRDVAEGDVLRSHDIIPVRLVQRGSLVTMKIQTAFITVTTQGKAQQDGAQGDVIRVTNTESNRVVEGTVVAPGIVEIHTAQKLAAAE